MKLGTSDFVLWIKDGKVTTNLNTNYAMRVVTDNNLISELENLKSVFSSKSILTDAEKMTVLSKYCDKHGLNINFKKRTYNSVNRNSKTPKAPKIDYVIDTKVDDNPIPNYDLEALKTSINQLINFFTEFEFEPNFRFINCFAFASNQSLKNARDYVTNYFKLIDSPDVNSIIEKIKSSEFINIVDSFKNFLPTKRINKRFKIYYGSAGTGKTTRAMQEADGNCMVCHSAMLPSDLMEDFKFDNGKATFIPSALQNAMENGKPIVLDEINLLPFESLRFLQTILDGKKQFSYKGKTVHINDGFKIIGTMNLKVNGSTFCLPDPLVDRAEDIREFRLKADGLIGAII